MKELPEILKVLYDANLEFVVIGGAASSPIILYCAARLPICPSTLMLGLSRKE